MGFCTAHPLFSLCSVLWEKKKKERKKRFFLFIYFFAYHKTLFRYTLLGHISNEHTPHLNSANQYVLLWACHFKNGTVLYYVSKLCKKGLFTA